MISYPDFPTVPQIRAARALLGWTQRDLASSAGISTPTLADHEREARVMRESTWCAVVETLQGAGIEFTARGVQLAKKPGA